MRLLPLLPMLALFGGGCAVPANTIDKSSDETAVGRKLYLSKCAKCHKLYDPAGYSDEEWQKWMGKMSRKAKLNEDQIRILSSYIDEKLRQPAKTHEN